MAKDFRPMEDSNRSSNPSIHDVSRPARRRCCAAASARRRQRASRRSPAAPRPARPAPLLGFKSVPSGVRRRGRRAGGLRGAGDRRLGRAGRHLGGSRRSASTPATPPPSRQAQMGMHHDGIHYYPLPAATQRAGCW
jgi:hypothetical protein